MADNRGMLWRGLEKGQVKLKRHKMLALNMKNNLKSGNQSFDSDKEMNKIPILMRIPISLKRGERLTMKSQIT